MEQVQQLIEILKSTPEMALWGLGLFFGWTLLKLASVTGAITMVVKLAINKFYDFVTAKLEHDSKEKDNSYDIRSREIGIREKEEKRERLEMRKDDLFDFLINQSSGRDVTREDWKDVIKLTLKMCRTDSSLNYMHKNYMEELKKVLKEETRRRQDV